jgi:hypothetical protein
MAITNYDKCTLLLPFNEADESVMSVDYSPKKAVLEFVGNAKIDTATLGASALTLDGSGDCVRIRDSSIMYFPGDFKFSFRFRTGVASQNRYILSSYLNSTSGVSIGLNLSKVVCNLAGDGTLLQGVTTISNNTEYYVEVERTGSTVKLYLNGTQEASITSSSVFFANQTIFIGRLNDSYGSVDWNGTIRDLEIFGGAGGNTSSYTPPAAASSIKTLSNASAANKVLDDAGNLAIRTIRAYPYDWPVRGFETQSDASGNFSLSVPDLTSGFLVTCLDNDAGTVYNALRHSKVVPG